MQVFFRSKVLPFLSLLLSFYLAGPAGSGPAAAASDGEGAVVIVYHRFGEGDLPSTSIRLDQFEDHLAELTSGRYNVLPLPDLVAALREKRPLPPRSVAITIDDAFASVYHEAWPRLRAAGLPFTLFVATEPLDRGLPGYLGWDELREMYRAGGMTIGNHGHDHRHMTQETPQANEASIATAAARLQAELGFRPTIFAYPYGEFGAELRGLVEASGFEAAFGQHSGAIGRGSDLFALSRFPLNEAYGDMERLRLVLNSLPLAVADVVPADLLLRGEHSNPPAFGFTLSEQADRAAAVNCFAGNNQTSLEHLGGGRIEVRFASPFAPGPARVNCTLPGQGGRWHWFGTQFYVES